MSLRYQLAQTMSAAQIDMYSMIAKYNDYILKPQKPLPYFTTVLYRYMDASNQSNTQWYRTVIMFGAYISVQSNLICTIYCIGCLYHYVGDLSVALSLDMTT